MPAPVIKSVIITVLSTIKEMHTARRAYDRDRLDMSSVMQGPVVRRAELVKLRKS